MDQASEPKPHLGARVSSDVLRRVETMCKAENRTRSNAVETLLIEALDAREREAAAE